MVLLELVQQTQQYVKKKNNPGEYNNWTNTLENEKREQSELT
jgi:hypothetical protein